MHFVTATLYLPPVGTILSESNLTGANLAEVRFLSANLTGANMREAKFLNTNPKSILSIALSGCDNLRIVVNEITTVIGIQQIHKLLA
ncbi:pentapeptide repeat-containing protein [Nostoc sp. KVJ20]|uniref:pentapeptide repeat-containing protein n=1 Tax=Nostoc sp. KVJ20 TaxID=457944 RepID=UPI000A07B3BB|nr:pentapeptide repeat-containing protein [Nostoc sp. KVJ20]